MVEVPGSNPGVPTKLADLNEFAVPPMRRAFHVRLDDAALADPDFTQRALALALHRQAQGLIQHPTMDVFHKLPRLLPSGGVATLDALAT